MDSGEFIRSKLGKRTTRRSFIVDGGKMAIGVVIPPSQNPENRYTIIPNVKTGFYPSTRKEVLEHGILDLTELDQDKSTIPVELNYTEQIAEPITQLYNDCVPSAIAQACSFIFEGRSFSPLSLYGQRPGKYEGDNGTRIPWMLDVLAEKGITPLKSMPYVPGDPNQEANENQLTISKLYKLDKKKVVSIYSDYQTFPDFEQICRFTAKNGPIIAAMRAYLPQWDIHGEDFIYPVDTTTYYYFGHSVLITGYSMIDRTITILNSWGGNWGINGTAKVSWDSLTGSNFNEAWGFTKEASRLKVATQHLPSAVISR